jgi:hypothetical protein
MDVTRGHSYGSQNTPAAGNAILFTFGSHPVVQPPRALWPAKVHIGMMCGDPFGSHAWQMVAGTRIDSGSTMWQRLKSQYSYMYIYIFIYVYIYTTLIPCFDHGTHEVQTFAMLCRRFSAYVQFLKVPRSQEFPNLKLGSLWRSTCGATKLNWTTFA